MSNYKDPPLHIIIGVQTAFAIAAIIAMIAEMHVLMNLLLYAIKPWKT
jgi:vacuolar-type H+-ATPase subunit B/Vma2